MKFVCILLLALYAVQARKIVEKGYGFSCEKIGQTNLCPKAVSFPKGLGKTIRDPIVEIIQRTLSDAKASQKSQECVTALEDFLCTYIPQCVNYRNLLFLDNTKIALAKEELDKKCGREELLELMTKLVEIKRNVNRTCDVVTDRTTYCPNVNFKTPIFGSIGMTEDVTALKDTLDKKENIIGQTCYETVKKIGCFLSRGPVCSDDDTYFMSPINKEECKKMLACLTKTLDHQEKMKFLHSACGRLPEATDQRVPMPMDFPTDVLIKTIWRKVGTLRLQN